MLNKRILKMCQHPFHISSVIKFCNLLPASQQIRQKRTHEINSGQLKLLMEVFGCSYQQASSISFRHTAIRTLDQNHIRKVADVLHRFGIDKGDIAEHPEILTIFPTTIENRAMLLQEGGFSAITANIIVRYITITRKPLRLLKAYQYIPSQFDIPQSFLSYLNEPPPPFNPISGDALDDKSFVDIQVAVLRHYLCWRLEMQSAELDVLMKTYSRLKNRSFRLVEESLKILEEKIGFSKEKIRRHGYLMHTHPGNTLDTLNRIKTIGGESIITVFHRYPKVIASATDTLIKTAQYLHDFGIPDAAIQKCPELFTLGSDTVFQRLTVLQSVPEFSGLAKNPRVLRLVHYQRKAYSRLSFLQQLKMKCASLHILSSPQAHFDRYVREGSDRTRGVDMTKFLSLELDASEVKIRKLLARHPYWCHVPLVTVRDTLDFLLNRGFTKCHILFNIHALLYSRSVM
ncbi:hypothetical protein B7P43_G10864 [Cryptotermes secundus]|uniref:Transcription termination factor 5, mitochondrial n=1 Tax=Cryptotermes secundus TaxID=105785 RepID=A0A2J7Q208_9NEOP|nr:hypothetical protein B7P43_G10864 [Cryptotermes secundus]PNF22609.1 hypothetical protein B7P43_G10864 [Cryptotermes secundus]